MRKTVSTFLIAAFLSACTLPENNPPTAKPVFTALSETSGSARCGDGKCDGPENETR
jgi:hypothetical protein